MTDDDTDDATAGTAASGEESAGDAATAGGTDERTAADDAAGGGRGDGTVLITGCSSGIGRATAEAFLADGWTVYATARDADDLADLAEAGCRTDDLDVTDQSDVERVVGRIEEAAGGVDCLVNNAGYGQLGPVEDVPVEDVHRQFDVNVYGPHRLARAVLPGMRDRGEGTIVNVSTVWGRLSFPGGGVYSASKHALEAESDALRNEVEEFGIDVVVVEPGVVATNFADRAIDEADDLPRTGAYEPLYDLLDDYDTADAGTVAAIEPDRVAATILDAANVTDPDPRYAVGDAARYALLARYLPDRWFDRVYGLIRRVVA